MLQKGDIFNASSAAFTHHVFNTNYTITYENVQWYKKKLPKDTELIDREAYVRIFKVFYNKLGNYSIIIKM